MLINIMAMLLDSSDGGAFVGFILFVIAAYFAPTIIVVVRKKRSFAAIAAVNFFLGWTLVGWVVALAWALKDDQQPFQVVVQQVTPPPQTAPSMLCRACGKYSPSGGQFCQNCGAKL